MNMSETSTSQAETGLFEGGIEAQTTSATPTMGEPARGPQNARTRKPVRGQMVMVFDSLDMRLPADHKARAIVQLVEARFDLDSFYAKIKVGPNTAGRTATDPGVMAALWLLAYSDAVTSAREIERLCGEHDAYRWICGGQPVNYHTLSDFQRDNGPLVDELFASTIAALVDSGLVSLEAVSIDGTRCRASAGLKSFRKADRLREFHQEAKEHLAKLKAQPPEEVSARKAAAQLRAARERETRLAAALEAVAEIAEKRESKGESEEKVKAARASMTDPECRIMKMQNGGRNPGFNVQIGTDNATKIPVAVDVIASSADQGTANEMVWKVEETAGKKPESVMIDSGFMKRDDMEEIASDDIKIFIPVDQNGITPEAQKNDGPGMTAIKALMATQEGKDAYRQRAAAAELTNAECVRRGMKSFQVRGLRGAQTVATLTVLSVVAMRVAAQFPDWLWGTG